MINNFNKLGPGLLFAGAAVGVSHLVYSTKAGAIYGFGLLWILLMANIFKYPFFEFGARYASSRQESLLRGYKQIGNWVLVLFILINILTMFTIQAAVSLVTASLVVSIFGLSGSLIFWVAILLLICAVILIIGKYKLLDQLMKVIIIGLTIITLITVMVAFQSSSSTITLKQFMPTDSLDLIFVIAFMGWMPAPLDLSVWHSVWALEKNKHTATTITVNEARFDFNVGYLGTTVLAIFFLAMGALVMFESGTVFSDKGAVFASQLIELYTQTLGEGIGHFVSIAALVTMFSTTITCLDALPKTMAKASILLLQKEKTNYEALERSAYLIWMLVLCLGTMIILLQFLTSMGSFLKIATILSFLTAPFYALANYYLVSKFLPEKDRPGIKMKLLSWLGIAYLLIFSIIYCINVL